MNQVSSPNVLLLYVRSGLRRWHLCLRMFVFIAHTISYPHRLGEICAQTKHLSAEHTRVWTLEAAATTIASRTHRHKYNSLTTFSFCKLCGTVSGNLFIFLFFDDVVAVHTCRCRFSFLFFCSPCFCFHSYRPFMGYSELNFNLLLYFI